MAQEQATKPSSEREQDPAQDNEDTVKDIGRAALLEDLDDLLNQIDDVLESNAEDFVKSYYQRGGQ